MLSQQNVKIYCMVIFFVLSQKKKSFIWHKTCRKKHNGNIFETFEASLAVLSIASIKLHFTKSPLVTMF